MLPVCKKNVARGGIVRGSQVRFPMLSLEFFVDINPSGCTVVLESTQPPTGMSARKNDWSGIGGWYVGLTLPPSCSQWLKIWEPQPPGTLCAGVGIAIPLPLCKNLYG